MGLAKQSTRSLLRLTAGILGAVMLLGCAGLRGALVPDAATGSALPRITAQWLAQQPGKQIGEFGFHLLDADGQALGDWQGLDIVQDDFASTTFMVHASGTAPDDIYLYVTYPGRSFALDAARLAESRATEYLMLAVPHRIEDVLVVGLARVREQRQAAKALAGAHANPGSAIDRAPEAPLLSLSFSRGPERHYRQLSTVNEDPQSAPVLEIESTGAGNVCLGWDERNVGDYNNNGEVEIADITPVGLYFKQRVSQSSEPAKVELADGDGNDEVNVADLTPIGRNFQRSIQGYSVYRANTATPQAGDFSALGRPTVFRADLWNSLTSEQRKLRLHYQYDAAALGGPNHYYVRAYSNDGGTEGEGPWSNTVSHDVAIGNQPPYWEGTGGLISAVGSGDGIRVSFPRAVDPEGEAVTYVLRYVEGFLPVGSPGTIDVLIPAGSLSGFAPYSYMISGLVRASPYTLNIHAQDPEGLSSSSGTELQARVPALGTSTDTWPYTRFDPARTGCNPACTLTEPLTPVWSQDLGWDMVQMIPDEPVISSDGWLGAGSGDGRLRRFNIADGADIGATGGLDAALAFRGSLDGTLLASGNSSGWTRFIIGNPQATAFPGSAKISAGTLLLGDFVFTADESGLVRCLVAATGEEQWHWPASAPGIAYYSSPAADAQYLYLVRSDGKLDKLDLLSGENMASATLAASPASDSLVLDEQRGRLFLAAGGAKLLAIRTSDLSTEQTWPMGGLEEMPGTPCVIAQASPPLVVQLLARAIGPTQRWTLQAFRLDDLTDLWTFNGNSVRGGAQLSAGQSRIFLADQDGLLNIVDFEGNLRQSVTISMPVSSLPVLSADRIAVVSGGAVQVLGAASGDGPPVWQGAEGIREISGDYGVDSSSASITVEWDYAVDDNAEPVRYVIYYATGAPPQVDPPYTGTTLITDIPNTGTTHSYKIFNLALGTRYYAAVRAYDGKWGEDPHIDTNANWLATTPPWQREELRLGTDLPAGEAYFMRGLLDPNDVMHLVYNDANDTHLTHAYYTVGAWHSEFNGLSDWPAVAFQPVWNPQNGMLTLGWADNTGTLGVLTRIGGDNFSNTDIGDATPVTNPQLSLACGTKHALAYTQYVSGIPSLLEHYYITQFAGSWQPVAPLDEENLSGRDISLVLDPADDSTPWIACQRGFNQDPNRLTPLQGWLTYARGDGLGGYSIETLDKGENDPDSDCGKRAVQVLDGLGHPHIAYLDLNASSTQPLGQLKYMTYNGLVWSAPEVVHSFDLSFQTNPSSLQFTWGELGLALNAGGAPVIGYLGRRDPPAAGAPHGDVAYVFVREGPGSWRAEQLTDAEYSFPEDREPCVLLIDASGTWHLFYVSGDEAPAPTANKIVHLMRIPPPAAL